MPPSPQNICRALHSHSFDKIPCLLPASDQEAFFQLRPLPFRTFDKNGFYSGSAMREFKKNYQDGTFVPPARSIVHLVKSISLPHPAHTCFLSNSSENISFSFPQLGHLQIKAFKLLNRSNPGQCRGVVMITSCLKHIIPPISFQTLVRNHGPSAWPLITLASPPPNRIPSAMSSAIFFVCPVLVV